MDGIPTVGRKKKTRIENSGEAIKKKQIHSCFQINDGCDFFFEFDAFLSVLCNFSGLLTSTLHHFVEFALDVELRMFGFHTFQFDGYFLSCSNVGT